MGLRKPLRGFKYRREMIQVYMAVGEEVRGRLFAMGQVDDEGLE